MALSEFNVEQVKLLMEEFLKNERPPERLREQVDLGYRIDSQSVLIFEIRPLWDNPREKVEEMVAKATFVQDRKVWKVFWQRADLRWHRYDFNPEVRDFGEFLSAVREDEYCCFWG